MSYVSTTILFNCSSQIVFASTRSSSKDLSFSSVILFLREPSLSTAEIPTCSSKILDSEESNSKAAFTLFPLVFPSKNVTLVNGLENSISKNKRWSVAHAFEKRWPETN